MDIMIRESTSADKAQLKSLIAQLHDYVRRFDGGMPEVDKIIDDYVRYLEKRCSQEAGRIFVAEQGARLLGYVCVLGKVHSQEPDDDPESFAVIQDIYVDENYQGRGLGTKLISEAEQYAKALGAKKIQLWVFSENQGAIGFYQKMQYRDHVRAYLKNL